MESDREADEFELRFHEKHRLWLFVVGIASSVVPQYVPGFEKMPLAPAFILILAVLLFRPEGLFGRKQVQRV